MNAAIAAVGCRRRGQLEAVSCVCGELHSCVRAALPSRFSAMPPMQLDAVSCECGELRNWARQTAREEVTQR